MFHSVELSKAAPNENPSPTPVTRDAASGMIPLAACLCSGPRTCPASVALHRWIIVYRARPCPSPPFISNNTFRCPRLLSARMMSPFLLLPTPERGVGGAPGGAHLVSSSRLRGARAALAKRDTSRCDRDGAPRRSTVAIFGPRDDASSPAVRTGSALRRARGQAARPGRVPDLPCRGSRRGGGTPLPAPPYRIVSGRRPS